MNPEIQKLLYQHGWIIHSLGEGFVQFVQKAGAPSLKWQQARDLLTLAGYTVYDSKIPRPIYLHVSL